MYRVNWYTIHLQAQSLQCFPHLILFTVIGGDRRAEKIALHTSHCEVHKEGIITSGQYMVDVRFFEHTSHRYFLHPLPFLINVLFQKRHDSHLSVFKELRGVGLDCRNLCPMQIPPEGAVCGSVGGVLR